MNEPNGIVEFFVPGIPQPGGSKKAYFVKALGRAVITDTNPKVKDWRATVAQCASEVAKELLDGPLCVRFDFVLPRSKGHFGSGKNSGSVKASAPQFPTGRPDATKLVRSTEDALKGILWRDDSQIVTQAATKRYGDKPGCLIRIKQEKV